jgi:hypothetical protein
MGTDMAQFFFCYSDNNGEKIMENEYRCYNISEIVTIHLQ